MVFKKGVLFSFVVLFAVLLNLNAVTAGIMCADDQIIFKLSSTTNAHGEVWSGAGNYATEICYDDIFGTTGNGLRTCTGTNEVIGLSSATNAHGEDPSLNNYGTPICYGDLTCTARSGSCVGNESLVVSLSSSTNAHLATSGYPINVCCTAPIQEPPPCTLNSASWDRDTTTEDTVVTLNVLASNCDGNQVIFSVWEAEPGADNAAIQNPPSTFFSGGSAGSTWTAEWVDDGFGQGDPEYFFIATVGSQNLQSSNQLSVSPSVAPPVCGNGAIESSGGENCDDGNNQSGDGCSGVSCQEEPGWTCTGQPSVCTLDCSLSAASWSLNRATEGSNVTLNVNAPGCNGQAVSFVILEDDDFSGDDAVNTTPSNVAVSNGLANTVWAAEWQEEGFGEGATPEYKFTATLVSTGEDIDSSNQVEVIRDVIGMCQTTPIVLCSDYGNQPDCQDDLCGVADNSDGGTVDCNNPNTDCSCSWNTSSSPPCGFSWTDTTSGGTCTNVEQDIGDNCNDGFLTVNFTATWTFSNGTIGSDPSCQSSTRDIICPAQIPLPFFTFLQMLIALVLIAVIYWALNRKGKGSKKKKR